MSVTKSKRAQGTAGRKGERRKITVGLSKLEQTLTYGKFEHIRSTKQVLTLPKHGTDVVCEMPTSCLHMINRKHKDVCCYLH